MEQLEIEFKILLTETIYKQMLVDFKEMIIKQYQQTNYYLMHPKLDELQYMLRIRQKDDGYELTLKRKAPIGNIETNIAIDQQTKDTILSGQEVDNEIFTLLKEVGIQTSSLDSHYSLTTYRSDIEVPQGTISIDYNQYNGCKDYELEFEVHDYQEGKQAFLNLLKPYSLTYQKNCDSKIKRLKQTL